MTVVKILGYFLSVFAAIGFAILILAILFTSRPSDGILMGICAIGLLAALAWGLFGARQPPKWLTMILFLPSVAIGCSLLIVAYERYPLLSPWLTGVMTVIAFAVALSALSWRAVGGAGAFARDAVVAGRTGDPASAALVYLCAGVLLLQPLIVLLNGQADARPPLVVPGIVTKAYQTHGKGAANYIVLYGRAAAYGTTSTPGEYSVDNDTYDASPRGARKCVTIHTGLLRLHWWSIRDC